jgi:hypothetical protein
VITSKKDASKAAKLLGKASTPKNVRSVAGSDLAQAKRRGRQTSRRAKRK